jgi:hypothetical protein
MRDLRNLRICGTICGTSHNCSFIIHLWGNSARSEHRCTQYFPNLVEDFLASDLRTNRCACLWDNRSAYIEVSSVVLPNLSNLACKRFSCDHCTNICSNYLHTNNSDSCLQLAHVEPYHHRTNVCSNHRHTNNGDSCLQLSHYES